MAVLERKAPILADPIADRLLALDLIDLAMVRAAAAAEPDPAGRTREVGIERRRSGRRDSIEHVIVHRSVRAVGEPGSARGARAEDQRAQNDPDTKPAIHGGLLCG